MFASLRSISTYFRSIVAEPYNFLGRRGRKEPEALAAASSKRLFVENQPYLIGGYSRNEVSAYECIHGSKVSQMNTPTNIVSMAEKYKYMKETYKKRLTFGKHSFFLNLQQILKDIPGLSNLCYDQNSRISV